MPKEASGILCSMSEVKEETISGFKLNFGLLYGKEVAVAVSGVGKVSAAMCAQVMILRFKVDEIINVGIAGSLSPELRVFDFVVANKLCQHDFDTSATGDPVGFISGVDKIYFESCERINNLLKRCVMITDAHYLHGIIASGDVFVTNPEKKKYIAEAFGAVACEMEGAAIAQVCFANGVDFGVLRCISDAENADMDYMRFAEIASKKSADIIKEYIKRA